MINKIIDIIDNQKESFSTGDLDFSKRVYENGLEKYKQRLNNINFFNQGKVLDAGSGFGQWSLALSELNNSVYSIEYAKNRVDIFGKIINDLDINNINLTQGNIENLPYEDNYFDLIFCYNVLSITDWKKTLKEFYRVLKPGGKLYFNTTGIGWYYFLIFTEHNKCSSYDPRGYAKSVIINTDKYNNHKDLYEKGLEVIIDKEQLLAELFALSFENTLVNGEGKTYLNSSKNYKDLSFYEETYFNEVGCYEIVSQKTKS